MRLKKSDLSSALRNSVDEFRYSIDAIQYKHWARIECQGSVLQDGDVAEFGHDTTYGSRK